MTVATVAMIVNLVFLPFRRLRRAIGWDDRPSATDKGKVDFEDNWAYPWPSLMYEPVLKIRLQPSHGREPEPHDLSFKVYYDPEMVSGYYSRPKTAEERELDLRYESSARFADAPVAVQSKSSRDIFEFPSHPFQAEAEIAGDSLRVKFLNQVRSLERGRGGDDVYWGNVYVDGIKKSTVPIIPSRPREFLVYLLKHYINLPALPEEACFPLASRPNLRRIEMCVSQAVLTKVLKLNPADYMQVEPDWYCLAARELDS
jgi:hypothetical protein